MAQRATVVLLHSSASSARQWDGLVNMLKGRYRVHAIDLYGHGQQVGWGTDAPLTLADEAARVAPLLADAGAYVIGHSYGGAVALKMAAMVPQSVRAVAAYEPVMFRWLIDDLQRQTDAEDVITVADAMFELLWEDEEQLAAMRFVDFWSGRGAWKSLPESTRCAIAARIRFVMQQFDALFHEPLQPTHVARLKMPMLFMSGTRTVAAMQGLADVLRSTLPAAQHESMEAMGHMGPITNATEVNRRLVNFLDAHASEPALEWMSEAA